jgi:hypothetical protein
MGATRKRTRLCSDSMRDPNCPRLGERSRMTPERGGLTSLQMESDLNSASDYVEVSQSGLNGCWRE